MKISHPLVVALVLLGVAGPFGGLAEAQKSGTIAGVVELACPADPTGTLVFIPGRSFIVITDSSGQFELSPVPVGTYTIRIEPTGQGPYHDVANVVVSQNKTTDLQTS